MIVLGKIALGLVGTVVASAGLLCSEGMIQLNVVEKCPVRHHIFVMAPALLVPFGMQFAPKENLAQASAEIQPWLPTIRAALGQLHECGDFALVEAYSHGQHVRVAKSGGSLVVDVKTEEESVHVSAPIRAISGAVEELAAVAPAPQR
jgi:hypothetical protein